MKLSSEENIITDVSSVNSTENVPNLANLYQDALSCIAKYLEPWDLVNMSMVSKEWYRLIRKEQYRQKISYPFLPQYKLTSDQFKTLREMLEIEYTKMLVIGKVGSGKTWLAVAYAMYRFMKQYDDVCIIFVCPPTCVAQWSDFFKKYTNLPVISNYPSSCFNHKDWEQDAHLYRIFITSNLTLYRIVRVMRKHEKEFAIIQDEAHNDLHYEDDHNIPVIAFTASEETFTKRASCITDWKKYQLNNVRINRDIPPMKFVMYEGCGLYSRESYSFLNDIMKTNEFSPDFLRQFKGFTCGIYELRGCVLTTKYGKKKICTIDNQRLAWQITGMRERYKKYLKHHKIEFDETKLTEAKVLEWYTERAMKLMKKIPKFDQILALAKTCKDKGEKLIIFDINQELIPFTYHYLKEHGIDTYPFCTSFNPAQRSKLLDKFKEKGDVLIGSIAMLSESHNITESNHITFLRYPDCKEMFMQAFGRCHRYPQDKTVYIHLINSCSLEMEIAMNSMRCLKKKSKNGIKTFSISKEIKEFSEFLSKQNERNTYDMW